MPLQALDLVAPHGYKRQREFNLSTQSVTDHYLSCLGHYAVGNALTVVIRASLEEIPEPRDLTVLRVIESTIPFDFKRYWSSGREERKRRILELVHAEMLRLASVNGWEKGPLQAAFECVVAAGLRNVQRWPEPVANRSRTLRAQVEYDFDTDGIKGMMIVTHRDGSVRLAEPVFRLPPSSFHLSNALGKVRWVDASTVALISRSGEIVREVTVPATPGPG